MRNLKKSTTPRPDPSRSRSLYWKHVQDDLEACRARKGLLEEAARDSKLGTKSLPDKETKSAISRRMSSKPPVYLTKYSKPISTQTSMNCEPGLVIVGTKINPSAPNLSERPKRYKYQVTVAKEQIFLETTPIDEEADVKNAASEDQDLTLSKRPPMPLMPRHSSRCPMASPRSCTVSRSNDALRRLEFKDDTFHWVERCVEKPEPEVDSKDACQKLPMSMTKLMTVLGRSGKVQVPDQPPKPKPRTPKLQPIRVIRTTKFKEQKKTNQFGYSPSIFFPEPQKPKLRWLTFPLPENFMDAASESSLFSSDIVWPTPDSAKSGLFSSDIVWPTPDSAKSGLFSSDIVWPTPDSAKSGSKKPSSPRSTHSSPSTESWWSFI